MLLHWIYIKKNVFLKNFLVNYFYKEFVRYPVYINLSYNWNFGVLSLVCLFIQIISGIFLAMFYIPSTEYAFFSVENIMRNVNYGFLIRYIHANGASFFFFFVYLHFLRNIYYNSYIAPREVLWVIGMLILILMIITAFMGYVLPWGQMSFWAATVITSLFSAIPFFGDFIVIWLWGGYSVDYPTLNRFFSLHYLLPFILLLLVILHILFLHEVSSTNPLGVFSVNDKIIFSPYYIIKDWYGILIFFFIFFIFIFFYPNYLGHPDNYIMANPLVTPAHIVPEWYFLPFYAILRSIPNKLGGILMLVLALLALILLPFIVILYIRNTNFYVLNKLFFWYFVLICLFLGWLGGKPIEYPFIQMGQVFTLFYFFYLIFLISFLHWYNSYGYLKWEKKNIYFINYSSFINKFKLFYYFITSLLIKILSGFFFVYYIVYFYFLYCLNCNTIFYKFYGQYYLLLFIEFLIIFLLIILTVAYMTLYERKVLGSIQKRKGPNIVGWLGLLQAFADAIKLILKESIIPIHSNRFIFIFSPILILSLSLFSWAFISFSYKSLFSNLNISFLCLFAISSLSVYNIIGAGWSSNSKYSFLGCLRASAQFIAYELVMSVVLLSLFLVNGTLKVIDFCLNQEFIWYIFGLFPFFVLFFIAALAETNRPPFDFPEAESELVSGYNVEYSAITFAFFFLGEYSYIFLISNIITISFLGGWNFLFFPKLIAYSLKVILFLFLFIWIRGTLPRYRYDQLMTIGWTKIVPLSFFFLICLCFFMYLYNFQYIYIIFFT